MQCYFPHPELTGEYSIWHCDSRVGAVLEVASYGIRALAQPRCSDHAACVLSLLRTAITADAHATVLVVIVRNVVALEV